MSNHPGLTDLTRTVLPAASAAMLDSLRQTAGGHRVWRERKLAEAHDLLALAAIAPRMVVEQMQLATDLRAIVRLQMPVPCRFGNDPLVLAHQAVLGLRFPREAMFRSLPGTAFVQVLQPLGTFHSNVSEGPVQVLCLGAHLPPGIRCTELLIMSYRALALQEHTLDVADPAGILRADAAQWWQHNTDKIPLTREAFLPRAEVPHDSSPLAGDEVACDG